MDKIGRCNFRFNFGHVEDLVHGPPVMKCTSVVFALTLQEDLAEKSASVFNSCNTLVYSHVRYAARTGQNGHEHSVSARLDAVFIEL
jgi:hypothetical protein